MNIEFKLIDRENYQDCIDLSVNDKQSDFVAPNIFSLVQAAYEPNLYPLGVYYKEKMVGFILYDYDEDLSGWSMSRFMIDVKYQNIGIGTKVLEKFIEFFINKYGHLPLYTSCEVGNLAAITLYEKLGFEKREVFEYEHRGKKYREFRMIANL